jgi:hypothetical protein
MPRGWLLVFCVLLIVGEPTSLALAASGRAIEFATDPIGIAVMAARLLVGAVGIAAGLALWSRRPAGPAIAKAYLIAASALVIFMVTTSFAPLNLLPGVAQRLALVIVAQNVAWFVYLTRSRQVRMRS